MRSLNQPSRLPPVSPRSGFTLTELLVTLTILTICAALSFPYLNRAIQSMRDTKCMSNVRQLVQGIITYAADNDGWIPAHEISPSEVDAFRLIYKNGYVTDENVFVCPVNKLKGRTPLGRKALNNTYDCYYSSNVTVVTYWGTAGYLVKSRPAKITESNATKLPVVFDQRANQTATSTSLNAHHPEGKSGGMFGYLDGSVEYLVDPANIIRVPLN